MGHQNMESSLSLSYRFRSSWRVISLILVISVVLLGAVLLLHYWKGIPIGNLTRDPITVVRAPPYTGFISQIGIFFWSASAAVCFLSAKVLSRLITVNLKIKCFLIVSGMLTLVLGIDDVFLLHEQFFPYFGVPEKAVLGSYAGFVLFYLVKFYSIILKTEFSLLAMALIFFGLSIILDLLQPHSVYSFLLEDGAKLVGIVSWLGYFFTTAASAIYHNSAQQITAPAAIPLRSDTAGEFGR